MKKHATSILLLALAVALGVYVAIDWGKPTTSERQERQHSLLETFRGDDVTSIEIEEPSGKATLTRTAPDALSQREWEITIAGSKYAAEESVADRFTSSLGLGSADHRVDDGAVDRKAFGLEAPRATITIHAKSDTTVLVLGGEAPKPSHGVYAEVRGHGVFVITRELAAALLPKLDDLRARALVPFGFSDVAALSLDGPEGARHFERATWTGDRGAGFRFDGTTPEGRVRVDATALDKAWIAIGGLVAMSFLSDADADKAIGTATSITITPRSPKLAKIRIDVGGACPGEDDSVVAIRREPSRISTCVSWNATRAIVQPTAAFVDRRLFGAPDDEIAELTIASPAGSIDMARSGDGWHVRKPWDRRVEGAIGKAVLDDLLGVTGTIVPAEEIGTPVATLRIASLTSGHASTDGGAGERLEAIEVGTGKDDAIVHRHEDGAFLRVTKADLDKLYVRQLALRSRRVIDEEDKDVRTIAVYSGAGSEKLVQRLERKDEGGFRLVEPKAPGVEADVGLATDLAEVMTKVAAVRWVSDKDDGSFGLDKPRFRIELGLGEKADRTIGVDIGAATSDGSFMRARGDSAVFVGDRSLEQAADRLFVDRSSMSVDAQSIVRVTVASAKKRVVVEQSSGGVKIVGGGDATKAAAIRDAAGELIPEGAVSIGKAKKDEGFDKPAADVTIEIDAHDGTKRAPIVVHIGAPATFHGVSGRFVRKDGVDATFVMATSHLTPFLDAI